MAGGVLILPHVDSPDPPVFAYYSDVILQDDGGAPAIWHIVITEYVVSALLRLLTAACDVAVGVACIDPRTGGIGRGVLVPLASSVPCKVDYTSLLEILCGSVLDRVASLIQYSRSSQVDCTWFEPAQRCYSYHFSSGRVLDDPER